MSCAVRFIRACSASVRSSRGRHHGASSGAPLPVPRASRCATAAAASAASASAASASSSSSFTADVCHRGKCVSGRASTRAAPATAASTANTSTRSSARRDSPLARCSDTQCHVSSKASVRKRERPAPNLGPDPGPNPGPNSTPTPGPNPGPNPGSNRGPDPAADLLDERESHVEEEVRPHAAVQGLVDLRREGLRLRPGRDLSASGTASGRGSGSEVRAQGQRCGRRVGRVVSTCLCRSSTLSTCRGSGGGGVG